MSMQGHLVRTEAPPHIVPRECAFRIQALFNDSFIPIYFPRADGAKRRARVLIAPGYLHPGKRKH
jgi:hypothetical protein